jgi:hypothetical protein
MVLIHQPPNAHVRISGILPSNAMATAAVKKILPATISLAPCLGVSQILLTTI